MTNDFKMLQPGRLFDGARAACGLGVMIKAPRAGFSKTRLSPPLTAQQAADLSRCFLQDKIANFAEINRADPRASGLAIYTPAGSENEFAGLLPEGFALLPQRTGDFGNRLAGAIEDLFSVGFAAAALVDSDSPTLPGAYLLDLVKGLLDESNDLVLGPSVDGGYYAIGLRRPCAQVFEKISWSTDQVFSETVVRAKEAKLRTRILPEWYDVDDASSLRALRDELSAIDGPGFEAPHSRQLLTQITIPTEAPK